MVGRVVGDHAGDLQQGEQGDRAREQALGGEPLGVDEGDAVVIANGGEVVVGDQASIAKDVVVTDVVGESGDGGGGIGLAAVEAAELTEPAEGGRVFLVIDVVTVGRKADITASLHEAAALDVAIADTATVAFDGIQRIRQCAVVT